MCNELFVTQIHSCSVLSVQRC